MKRLSFLLISLLLLLSYGRAEEADVHRFANYNIRYVNANNGDTGDKLWANRRQYVAQIVQDYDFDIVGLEEVTGNNSDPVTGKSQMQDLQDLLPQYTLIAYERENKQYSYNGLMYKSAKYDCLHHFSFWISQTPWQVSRGWTADDNIYRRCVMAHMRVKATGEEFWFCAAHCNYGPSQCAIQGAKMVTKIIMDSVGNLPVVLAGDFNMVRSVHTEAYRGYASVMHDAAMEVPATQNYCLPQTNPQVTNTGNNWIPVTQSGAKGSEFDYLFYRNMTPLSRHIITEYYGRSVNPSDHYPLLVRFRLGSPTRATRYYAHDEASLLQALQQADMMDTICLQAGTIELTSPVQLTKSVTLIGGYNSTYTAVEGRTSLALDGAGEPLFSVDNYYTLQLVNMDLAVANSTSANGGIIRTAGSQLRLWNCHLTGSSTTAGGAIYATSDSLVLYKCQFENCSSKNGGAVFANLGGELRVIDSYFANNSATDGGAALLASGYQSVNLQRSSFVNNQSTKQGTVYVSASAAATSVNVVNCSFLNNTMSVNKGLAATTRKFGGSAINVALNGSDQSFNMAHCTLMGNATSFTGNLGDIAGGALTVSAGKVCLMNNLMFSNPLTLQDGSLHLVDCALADGVNVARNTLNLTSDSVSIAQWTTSADSTFIGTLNNGIFTPEVDDKGCYHFLRRTLGGKDLLCVSTVQRLCEAVFGFDINGDGTIGGFISTDQKGHSRGIMACVGALEYEATVSAVEDITRLSDAGETQFVMYNGRILIRQRDKLYTLTGQLLY